MRLSLIHSPLVGPSTWRWVAGSLRDRGHDAVVPDLRQAAEAGDPAAYVAAAATPDVDALVGHSGAGYFLPAIGAAATTSTLVFVDAIVPPCDGAATPSGEFLDLIRQLAVDGLLPPWSTWWGPDAMERLVPDARRREVVAAEVPSLPSAFYESSLAQPPGWCAWPAGYVRLSPAYVDDAARARERGWPVVERDGTHLDIVNEPNAIADVIVQLASAP